MSKIKKVGFNFFRPIYEDDSGAKSLNLQELFERIRKHYLEGKEKLENGEGDNEYKHVYSYNDEPARLADISYDAVKEYYHLIFERLNYQVPNRTTLHGESKALELEEDEWIGIDVSVLYDPITHIFMIQRNRDSLGPSGIEKFIRTLLYTAGFEGNFTLAIVSDPTAKKRAFKQSAYRKIYLKVTGAKANNIVQRLRQVKRNIDVDSVEITFNCKQGRSDKLDEDFSKQVLDEYLDDPQVQKLQIRSREEEGDPVEPIDLIDHKLVTFKSFDFVNDGRQLNPVSVYERMVEIFEGNETKQGFKHIIMRM
ncbi:DUF6731 family protein [Paenibacillus larvae]